MPNRRKIFNRNLIVSCRTTQLCDPGASYNLGGLVSCLPSTEVTEKKAELTLSIKAACDQPPSIPNLLCSSALFLLVTFCIYIVILRKHNKSDVPRELTICVQGKTTLPATLSKTQEKSPQQEHFSSSGQGTLPYHDISNILSSS